jgi:LEA14-like dessication related protein
MKRPSHQFVLPLFLLSLLSACVGMPMVETISPKVSIADFKVKNLGVLEQNYQLRLQIKNPNPFPLPISGMDYKLLLNDKEFTHGESSQGVTIPASGEEFLDLEVKSNLMKVVEDWKNFGDWSSLFNRRFSYQLKGNVSVMEGTPLLPFDKTGEVSLSLWGKDGDAGESEDAEPAENTGEEK